jgi:hypothetical protein
VDAMDIDEPQAAATQLSVAQRNFDEVTPEIREHLISNVVRLFLFNESRRVATKRPDIIANAIGAEFKDKRVTAAVIDEARKRLGELFGFEVVELKLKQKGSYVLRSKFTPETFTADFLLEFTKTLSDREKSERGLLIIVLSLILINNYSMPQDMLFRYIQQLGFGEASASSWWVNAIAKSFPLQSYLIKRKEKAGDTERVVYSMGERSLIEIGKKRILYHVAKMLGEDADPVKLREIEAELEGIDPNAQEEEEEEGGNEEEERRPTQVVQKKRRAANDSENNDDTPAARPSQSKKSKK